MSATVQEGVVVNVGDYVSFKCDIEQGGIVSDINRDGHGSVLTIVSNSGFSGDYIGGDNVTTQHASDCWVE